MRVAMTLKIACVLTAYLISTGCGRDKADVTEPPSLVIITSSECGNCTAAKPLYEELRQKFGSRMTVAVFDINTEEGAFMATRLKVEIVPCLLFTGQSGTEIGRIEGDLVRGDVIDYTERILKTHENKSAK
jgi:thiol-disulfide isomerase/thioredoxin